MLPIASGFTHIVDTSDINYKLTVREGQHKVGIKMTKHRECTDILYIEKGPPNIEHIRRPKHVLENSFS